MIGYMYILKCSDGSYYVGSTNNLELRIAQHQIGEGANHTKKHLPVELVYYEEYPRIDEAFYREKQVQGWSRKKKEALINKQKENLHLLATCRNESNSKNFAFDSAQAPTFDSAQAPTFDSAQAPTFDSNLNRWLSGAETTYSMGNKEILNLRKTAFLCSRKIPSSIVLKCYDWAIVQREMGNCIISGFHSQIEKDVLHYLLKGKQPIIVVLARGLKEKLEPMFIKPMEEGRLLIITPFDKTVKRVTTYTANTRNHFMTRISDDIVVGYVSPKGLLENLINTITKNITYII